MSIKIGLDAGHGLKTAGKQTPDGIKEWSLNDSVCDKVQRNLAEYDCEIIRTDNNEGNVDEGLSTRRTTYINQGVNAFVSVHHNAFTGTWNNATGVEVYTDRNPISDDTRLAQCIYNRLVSYTGMKGRGIKQVNWAVINQNRIPAVLCEGGFMDGTNDYKYITSDAGQTAYAKAVAEGLIEFLGLKKKTTSQPATNTSGSASSSATVPFLIKVANVEAGDVLNIRKEPNANAEKTGALAYNDPNTYTIVETKNGWGRLKSGVGWISLKYTKTVSVQAPATIKPAPSPYYPKYTGSSTRVDEVFASIGVPEAYRGNYKKRAPIAKVNAISSYSGSATQNLKLIALAKEGKLKKV
jgi:N-acetylmuramoyl-L-alanine amidase